MSKIEFTEEEKKLLYAACMAYGETLNEMNKKVVNLYDISDVLSERAKTFYDLARKIIDN